MDGYGVIESHVSRVSLEIRLIFFGSLSYPYHLIDTIPLLTFVRTHVAQRKTPFRKDY
jgi:hypothetical protein